MPPVNRVPDQPMIAEQPLIGTTTGTRLRKMNLGALLDLVFGTTVLGLLLMWLVLAIVGGRA
jgi:hypothetical protein